MLEILQDWDRNLLVLRGLAEQLSPQHASAVAMSSLGVHPPVDLPRQVLCTGANYRKHVVDLTLDMGVGPEGLQGAAFDVTFALPQPPQTPLPFWRKLLGLGGAPSQHK